MATDTSDDVTGIDLRSAWETARSHPKRSERRWSPSAPRGGTDSVTRLPLGVMQVRTSCQRESPLRARTGCSAAEIVAFI